MKVLLTGPPRSGKSRLLRQLAEQYPGNAGGYLVKEILGPDRRRAGFELLVVWSGPGSGLRTVERAVLARLDPWSPHRVGKYWLEESAVTMAVQALDAAMHEGGLVLVDEIGPLQIGVPSFRDALSRCLDGPGPLLGAISPAPDPFLDALRNRPGLRLLEVNRLNSRHMAEGLQRWLCAGGQMS